MCGVVGVYNVADGQAADTLLTAATALQHRGQNGCGITVSTEGKLSVRKSRGTVYDLRTQEKPLELIGKNGIAHVRYPTFGGSDKYTLLASAQPEKYYGDMPIVMAHNGNVTNAPEIEETVLRANGILFEHHFQTGDDTAVTKENQCDIKYLLGTFASELRDTSHPTNDDIFEAARSVMKKVKGSYSAVALIKDGKRERMVAFTDPYRIRPLVLGKSRNSYMIASETCAFKYGGLDFDYQFDFGPGEAVIIDGNELHREKIDARGFRPCMFEFVYFASPDSVIDGVPVALVRYELGRKLGMTETREFDIVTPILNSGRHHANGFYDGLLERRLEDYTKLLEKYLKNEIEKRPDLAEFYPRFTDACMVRGNRTFISSDPKAKLVGKLSIILALLESLRVCAIDDSDVRGNTAKRNVALMRGHKRNAEGEYVPDRKGAKEVNMRTSIVPASPCFYGIDFPSLDELAINGCKAPKDAQFHEAAEKYLAELCGADSFRFNSPEIVQSVIRGLYDKYCQAEYANDPNLGCFACLNGDYPTPEAATLLEALKHGKKKTTRIFEVP